MRSFPVFAKIEAMAEKPAAAIAAPRSRWAVGALTVMGSLVVMLAAGGPAEARTATKTPAPTSYVLQKGDTLTDIAARTGLTVDAIVSANNINNKHKITAGDSIVIPVKGAATTKPATTVKAAEATTGAKAKGVKPVKLPSDFGFPNIKPSPGQAPPPDLRNRAEYLQLRPAFVQAANKYKVPVELLQAMAWQESGWQNKVVSSTGAVGVGQLMPDTIAFVNSSLVAKPLKPAIPAHNIEMSAAFLKYLLDENNGDQRKALASYYQGLTSVRRLGLMDETQQYVKSILAIEKNWF